MNLEIKRKLRGIDVKQSEDWIKIILSIGIIIIISLVEDDEGLFGMSDRRQKHMHE
jgi:hypothetical protein